MVRKQIHFFLLTLVLAGLFTMPVSALSNDEEQEIGQYGMLPVYGRDIRDGDYPITVKSSSSKLQIDHAELLVSGGEMTAVLTFSGDYPYLFMGTAEEATANGTSPITDKERVRTCTVSVEALDRKLSCAAFSQKDGAWNDHILLFEASSLPADALQIDLPDYDLIEAALDAWEGHSGTADSSQSSTAALSPAEAVSVELEDGEYSVSVDLAGGSGKASVENPTILIVRNGKAYAHIQWSSSNYDYMIVGTDTFWNTNFEGGNSAFEIPVCCWDSEMDVIANTTAMGEPREIHYTLTFHEASIGAKSQLPQEAAKRVVGMAAVIIIGGGILNFVLKRKQAA